MKQNLTETIVDLLDSLVVDAMEDGDYEAANAYANAAYEKLQSIEEV